MRAHRLRATGTKLVRLVLKLVRLEVDMSIKLNQLVTSLVETAPQGELANVRQDLSVIVNNQDRLINSAIEDYVAVNGGVFSSKYIASKLNQHSESTKYIDYINKQLFNIDVKNQQAIDFEPFDPQQEYPEYYNDLVVSLQKYGQDHYPSSLAFTIIPGDSEVYILLIGQKLNHENYYTGQWNSTYTIKDGHIRGDIKVDIHYFEDGNVRLGFEDSVQQRIDGSSKSIVNFINDSENKVTLKIVDNFNELNIKYFKNLRRLLPVTRSKVNWGNAIGNYKLGSDVVNNS